MVREYIMSIIITGLICSMTENLIPNAKAKECIRFLSGLLMTLAVIRPLHQFSFPDTLIDTGDLLAISQNQEQSGTDLANHAMQNIIIQETEAYIIHAGSALGLSVKPSVTLDENNIPCSVVIHGDESNSNTKQLKTIIASELGITEEQQVWIG